MIHITEDGRVIHPMADLGMSDKAANMPRQVNEKNPKLKGLRYVPLLDKVDGDPRWQKHRAEILGAKSTDDHSAMIAAKFRVTFAEMIGAEKALAKLQQENDELETELQDSRNHNARLRKVLEVEGE